MNPADTHLLPQEIRIIRKKLEMTQDGFADALKVTRKTVYYWEAGIAKPHRSNREAILLLAKQR